MCGKKLFWQVGYKSKAIMLGYLEKNVYTVPVANDKFYFRKNTKLAFMIIMGPENTSCKKHIFAKTPDLT